MIGILGCQFAGCLAEFLVRALGVTELWRMDFAKLDLQFHQMLCELSEQQWLFRQWYNMRTYIWLFCVASDGIGETPPMS